MFSRHCLLCSSLRMRLGPFSVPCRQRFGKGSKLVVGTECQLETAHPDLTWLGKEDPPRSENDVISSEFLNRNPRNLEQMGIARKRGGWKFQHPTVEFYHRLMFARNNHNSSAWVEHADGSTVISASTQEMSISQHLYSLTDVAAAKNIGRVIAQRCRQSGITSMILEVHPDDLIIPRVQAFKTAVEDGGIQLEEFEPDVPEYEHGKDYDMLDVIEEENRIEDVKIWQESQENS